MPRGQKKKMSQVYILESDGAKRFINSSFTSFLIAFPAFKVFSAFLKNLPPLFLRDLLMHKPLSLGLSIIIACCLSVIREF